MTNFKSSLQEICITLKLNKPNYKLTKRIGLDHEPLFYVKCEVGELCTNGIGSKRKTAESNSAKDMLTLIKINYSDDIEKADKQKKHGVFNILIDYFVDSFRERVDCIMKARKLNYLIINSQKDGGIYLKDEVALEIFQSKRYDSAGFESVVSKLNSDSKNTALMVDLTTDGLTIIYNDYKRIDFIDVGLKESPLPEVQVVSHNLPIADYGEFPKHFEIRSFINSGFNVSIISHALMEFISNIEGSVILVSFDFKYIDDGDDIILVKDVMNYVNNNLRKLKAKYALINMLT